MIFGPLFPKLLVMLAQASMTVAYYGRVLPASVTPVFAGGTKKDGRGAPPKTKVGQGLSPCPPEASLLLAHPSPGPPAASLDLSPRGER